MTAAYRDEIPEAALHESPLELVTTGDVAQDSRGTNVAFTAAEGPVTAPVVHEISGATGTSLGVRSWEQDIRAWVRHQIAVNVPQTTRDLRVYYVKRLASAFEDGPQSVTFELLVDWMADHPSWSPNTRRSVRTSLRAFWAWRVATGRSSSSPAHQLGRIRAPRPRPRPTTEEAYRQALETSQPREQLMIRLAAVCGLRRGELSRLHTDDVTSDLVGHSLRVIGKGGNERWVPLTDRLAETLQALPRGWVFPSSQSPTGHLQPAWIGKLVTRALPDPWTTHTLRHRCASVAYAAERDIRAVQELLGHASPNTTAIYIAVPSEAVRRAVEHAAA